MWAESDLGKGSTFHFTIHAHSSFADAPAYQRGREPLLVGKRVLIVDDSAVVGDVLGEWLRGWGVDARYVNEPQAALELVTSALVKTSPALGPGDRKSSDGKSSSGSWMPEVVLTDLEMPTGLTGLSLARSLREHCSKTQLPILLMCTLRQRHRDMISLGQSKILLLSRTHTCFDPFSERSRDEAAEGVCRVPHAD
mgnify:CR=1 FL=1